MYNHEEKDAYEIWTTKDIKAGEEMLCNYGQDYGPCKWFDEFHNEAGRTPLSQLGDIVDAHVMKMKSEKPWGKPAEGPTYNEASPTEFKTSNIPDAGLGWFAKNDIPKGTRLRRVSVADGTMFRFGSLDDFKNSGWDLADSVNYGIGHRKDPSSIFYLNPGTACNHADPTRDRNIMQTCAYAQVGFGEQP